MGNGLGDLGFWLAVGIVIAAMIVSGAIKERDRQRTQERERDATLPVQLEKVREREETLRALLEKGGENVTEVLAYLRERDAAAAARAEAAMRTMNRPKMSHRQTIAFVGAFFVGMFSFMGGLIALANQSRPAFPRLEFSAQAGRVIPIAPPVPPGGLEAYLPIVVMLAIWAGGFVIAALIVAWGGFGKPTNDVQPDA